MIEVTPVELFAGIAAVAAFMLTCMNIANSGWQMHARAKEQSEQPIKELKDEIHGVKARVCICEEKLETHDRYFDNDNKRLIQQEKATNVMLQSIMAIMTYLQTIPAQDENAKEGLTNAVNEVNKFLRNSTTNVSL